ncbi:MAG: serine/threonine protein kinase [Chlamydiales bacterium]|jgi:serine/threonine protein kinase
MTFIPILPEFYAKHLPGGASPYSGSTDTGGVSPMEAEASPMTQVTQKVFEEIREAEEGKVAEAASASRPKISINFALSVNPAEDRLAAALSGIDSLGYKRSDFSSWTSLSRGGSGEVFLAVHEELGMAYAVKSFYSDCMEWPLQEYLIRELSLTSGFDHPNIVNTIGYFKDAGSYYLVMDYMSGGDLFDKVQASETLDLEAIKLFTPQIAKGLSYLHEKGILYRDLKLENILLDESQTLVKLADFGVIKPLSIEERTLTACGSESYLAPEMIMGRRAASGGYGLAIDWWALGVSLYIMTVGYPPFRGKGSMQVYRQILEGALVFPEEILSNPEYSSLVDLIQGLLQKNPRERLQEDALLHPFLLA